MNITHILLPHWGAALPDMLFCNLILSLNKTEIRCEKFKKDEDFPRPGVGDRNDAGETAMEKEEPVLTRAVERC